jgi:hypothetical protein
MSSLVDPTIEVGIKGFLIERCRAAMPEQEVTDQPGHYRATE